MRTTVVPAQVTTVEDRIAGRISLSQLILLITPVFGGSGIFVILPPFFNYSSYKVVVIACIASLCALLAIRIKGKIVFSWLTVLLRYNLRPRYYVFNKNSTYARDTSFKTPVATPTQETIKSRQKVRPLERLSLPEHIHIQDIISNPLANMHITTNKKGELSVHITEVTQEGISTLAN